MSAPLLARFTRSPGEALRVYHTIEPGLVTALIDYAPDHCPPQEVKSLPALSLGVEMTVWVLEGWRQVPLCGLCGGHGWAWGPREGAGEGDCLKEACPACQGSGFTGEGTK